jgi:hypothetical protein
MIRHSLCLLLTSSLSLAEEFEVQQTSACSGSQTEKSACVDQPICNPCIPQDCEYSVWSTWSAPSDHSVLGEWNCTGLCGRTRTVTKPNSECGTPCAGNLMETKECYEIDCHSLPFDCMFNTWSVWSTCGSQPDSQSTRTRHIGQEAKNGGYACSGPMVEIKPCSQKEADICTYAPWTLWDACFNGCGKPGVSTRSRTVAGRPTRVGQQCAGSLAQEKNCPVIPCVGKVDCVLGIWTLWSVCNQINGSYSGERTRSMSFTAAQNGGLPCQTSPLQETAPCDGPLPTNCVLGLWSAWEPCTKDCGGGQQTRSRAVATPSANGGACPSFSSVETAPCMQQPCATDCSVAPWAEWEACPVTCGQGNRTRLRFFHDGQIGAPVDSKANRLLCPNVVLFEIAPCGGMACLPQDCQWSAWTYTPCSATCGEGVKLDTDLS